MRKLRVRLATVADRMLQDFRKRGEITLAEAAKALCCPPGEVVESLQVGETHERPVPVHDQLERGMDGAGPGTASHGSGFH